MSLSEKFTGGSLPRERLVSGDLNCQP